MEYSFLTLECGRFWWKSTGFDQLDNATFLNKRFIFLALALVIMGLLFLVYRLYLKLMTVLDLSHFYNNQLKLSRTTYFVVICFESLL